MQEFNRYIILLTIIFFLSSMLFYQEMEAQTNEIINSSISSNKQNIKISQRAFDKLSQDFYNTQNEYIAQFLYILNRVDKETQKTIREHLLTKFYSHYKDGRLLGLIQFQIQDSRGRSFLRFNNYMFYGDDLTKVRPAIKEVITNYRFLKGFEAGRFSDGLRYIYPLFYNGKFVGSYEWVWSHKSLLKEMKAIYNGEYILVTKRSYLKKRLYSHIFKNGYHPLLTCSSYLYQNSIINLYRYRFLDLLKEILKKRNLCSILNQHRDSSLAFKVQDRYYLLTTILLHDITGEEYGYLISIEQNSAIPHAKNIFLIKIALLLIVIVLIAGILYRINKEKILIRTLLDSQEDLIILSNEKRLIDANRAFLEFFQVKSVDEFVKKYKCICNFFIEADGFIGKKRINQDGWITYLLKIPQEKRRVLLFDNKRNEERIFSVTLNRFRDKNMYVVSLRDITDIEQQKQNFELEALLDHLTGIYNKRAFERYLKEQIRGLQYFRHPDIAIIMFDIDNFKEINDKYGHQWGDELLRELVTLTKKHIRKSDFFARWGGDEFIIIMIGVGLKEAKTIIEKLKEVISKYDFNVPETITCSFGITLIHSSDTLESVINRVDKLLYESKKGGKNRVTADNSQ